MRTLAMVTVTTMITALSAWGINVVSTTTPAVATAVTPSLNIMQMMRNAKALPVESYDACGCAF